MRFRTLQLDLPIPRSMPWYPAPGEPLTSRQIHARGGGGPIANPIVVSGSPAIDTQGVAMKTVAFVNKKGGVGKSSCVMHLGAELARRGIRTLLADVDSQASLSQGLLGRDALGLHPSQTLAGMYDSAGSSMIDLVMEIGRPRLALIAGHDRMTHYNVPDPWTTGEDQFILRDGLAEVAGDFDICLLDCPPHVQFCAWSALVAADGVVVPCQLEDFGIQGVAAILDSIDHARQVANPKLRLLGILPTMVTKSLAIHATYGEDARAVFGDDVFAATVPSSTDYKVAVTLRKAVVEHKPKSVAAKSMAAVADELLERLAGRTASVVSGTPVPEREVA
jgi:chromosome partitioning protein